MKPSSRTYLKVLLNLGIALIVALLFIFLAPKLAVFFLPFIVGWIIAMIASPLVRFFEDKLKIRRKAGTAFVIIAVIALVILLGYLVGAKLVEEVVGLIQELPSIWNNLEGDFRTIGKNLDVVYSRLPEDIRLSIANIGAQMDGYVASLVTNIGTPTIAAVGSFVKHLPSALIGMIMCLLSSYFFVAEKDYLSKAVRKYLPESVLYHWDLVVHSFKNAVGGYFKAQFKIEVWMYLLLVVGFTVLQVDYALLIAFGIAILDFLPFFGTGTVMIPWAIIKILSSDYKLAVGLLIIWCVGQLARQLIQPKIVGDSMGMAPLPTLVLLYVGYKLAGVIGMILAVPIGIIIANMFEEGVFDTTRKSLSILFAGINNFRRLQDEDMEEVRIYNAAKGQRAEERAEKEKAAEDKKAAERREKLLERERKRAQKHEK